MALKDIQIPKVDVVVAPGSSFAVRGLSTSDIEHLVRTHGESMRELFNQYIHGDIKALKMADLTPILKSIAGKVPGLVIDTVALAADADDEDLKQLKKLPVGVQINALMSIFGLTLQTEGDLGNVLEAAIKLLGGLNGGLDTVLQAQAS